MYQILGLIGGIEPLKHSFIQSFFYLLRYKNDLVDLYNTNDTFFKSTLTQVCKKGGIAIESNACIVGGMIGALVGAKQIDPPMIRELLGFDCSTVKNKKAA